MVMVEATACGTPVVALRRGSVPEVVADGETGVVVDEPDELPGAVRAAEVLDRRRCRARAEQCFDLPKMVAGDETAYRTVLEGRQLRLGARPDDTALVGA